MKRAAVFEAGAAEDGVSPAERVPNQRTAETLAKSERDEDLQAAKDADDLFDQLGV